MKSSYSYLPPEPKAFQCHIPGTQRFIMQDGVLPDETLPDGTLPDGLIASAEGLGSLWRLPEGRIEELPLQLISLRSANEPNALSLQNQWEIGRNAQAKLLVCAHTTGTAAIETSQQTRIQVAEGGQLELIVMQSEHNAATHRLSFTVDLARDSFFRCSFVSLHGGGLDNHLELRLNGEGARGELHGLWLTDKTQKVGFHIGVHHNAPQTSSTQLFKGILDDSARGLFEGLIRVAPGAQKTEAYQANHNLLLTRESKMFTRPQLEIYADDVKCSHGATIGRLDEQALFYLRSRGIPFKEARLLLQQAFLQDVLDRISLAELRGSLAQLVGCRLRGEFS